MDQCNYLIIITYIIPDEFNVLFRLGDTKSARVYIRIKYMPILKVLMKYFFKITKNLRVRNTLIIKEGPKQRQHSFKI